MIRTNEEKQSIAIANTIRDQIGFRAFTMVGASEFVAWPASPGVLGGLRFKLGSGIRNAKGKLVARVLVTLSPDDTYRVRAYGRASLGPSPCLGDESGVYVGELRSTIERLTGAYLSL